MHSRDVPLTVSVPFSETENTEGTLRHWCRRMRSICRRHRCQSLNSSGRSCTTRMVACGAIVSYVMRCNLREPVRGPPCHDAFRATARSKRLFQTHGLIQFKGQRQTGSKMLVWS